VAPGGGTVDTETVKVNGNGTYTTPTGYTLPTTIAVTGTYQWNAVFTDTSGNNFNATDVNDKSEQVPVSPAKPQITTTPSPSSVTLSGSSVTLKDSAVLSGGYSPTGTITFTLVAPNSTTVDTETVTVNGNGTYTTPTGYSLPSSGPTGTYQWNAVFTDTSGNNFNAGDVNDSSEQVTVTGGTPSLAITKTADQGSVAAGSTIGFTVTITNNGNATASGLMLTDSLPPGSGGDILWSIDNSKGNPSDFAITSPKGSQALGFSSSFLSSPDSLAPGQSISVHITSPTNKADVSGGLVGVNSGVNPNTYLGAAGDYGVVYIVSSGTHTLQITNVTIGANIGVGSSVGGSGTGKVSFGGPGTITGRLDFQGPNSGQFSNNNGSNVGPASVNYNDAVVTTAISTVTNLSTALASYGTSVSINGTQTINESAGQAVTVNTVGGPVEFKIFKVTSYSSGDGKMLTINGDGSGDPVVFNFGSSSNVNLGGDVALTGNGLSDDKVIWNFTSTGMNIGLNNNASSYPGVAFHGIILAPKDAISLVNANLSGRVYGGDAHDMQIVSGVTLHAPVLNTATVSAGNLTASASASITITGSTFKPPQALLSSDSGNVSNGFGVIGMGYAMETGTLLVYVDDSAGNMTADEHARIDDAISTYNSELASAGLTLIEVGSDQAASANVTISMADTTVIGGVADGVLGVTAPGGIIVLVSGWNWYTGSSASGIDSGQYDFETTALHELGHGIGLGHSPDTTSVMYPTLATGAVRRALSVNDLTLIDNDGGGSPEPLMAAPGWQAALATPAEHTPVVGTSANLSAIPTFTSSTGACAATAYNIVPPTLASMGGPISPVSAWLPMSGSERSPWRVDPNHRIAPWSTDVLTGPADADIAGLALGQGTGNPQHGTAPGDSGTPSVSQSSASTASNTATDSQQPSPGGVAGPMLGNRADETDAVPGASPWDSDADHAADIGAIAAVLDDGGSVDLLW
jgi:uncharacterized repeat protein (TIGR01451 family)